jgi:hypothetical protein
MIFLARFAWPRMGVGVKPVTKNAPAIFSASRRGMLCPVSRFFSADSQFLFDMNACSKKELYFLALQRAASTRFAH